MQADKQEAKSGKIVNITMKTHLRTNIDLPSLCSKFPAEYCHYNPNRFRGLVLKRAKKFCFLLFGNGAVILTGIQDPCYGKQKTAQLIQYLISIIINIIQSTTFQICNVVSAAKLKSRLDIAKFHRSNANSILEFEQFPGCSFPVYNDNPKLKCICFYSGSFHVVGCKTVSDSLAAIEYVIPLLSSYCIE